MEVLFHMGGFPVHCSEKFLSGLGVTSPSKRA